MAVASPHQSNPAPLLSRNQPNPNSRSLASLPQCNSTPLFRYLTQSPPHAVSNLQSNVPHRRCPAPSRPVPSRSAPLGPHLVAKYPFLLTLATHSVRPYSCHQAPTPFHPIASPHILRPAPHPLQDHRRPTLSKRSSANAIAAQSHHDSLSVVCLALTFAHQIKY